MMYKITVPRRKILFGGELIYLFSLGFAVNAAIGFGCGVCELEYMGQILLRCGYAAGVFALNNILNLGGKSQLFLFAKNAVLYDVNGDIRIDIAENIEVNLHFGINFDNILIAHFFAADMLYDCNRAVKLVKLKMGINLHAVAGFYMVKNNAVFN